LTLFLMQTAAMRLETQLAEVQKREQDEANRIACERARAKRALCAATAASVSLAPVVLTAGARHPRAADREIERLRAHAPLRGAELEARGLEHVNENSLD
jgi:hypothetical protein